MSRCNWMPNAELRGARNERPALNELLYARWL